MLLFYLGLVFPFISIVTLILSAITAKEGKSSSAVLVPFIGPLLLTIWIFVEGISLWTIPLAWVLDLGTVCFSYVMMKDFLHNVSRTKISEYHSEFENQSAVLSFYDNGEFLLEKRWDKKDDVPGMVAVNDYGSYVLEDEKYKLQSHFGLKRVIAVTSSGSIDVITENKLSKEQGHYSIEHWVFEKKS